MTTTLGNNSNEILSAVQINGGGNDSLLKPAVSRGIKRALSDDGSTIPSATVPVRPIKDLQENRQLGETKYLESNWDGGNPPVQAEVEVTSTTLFQFAVPQEPPRQSAQFKQQQAQLPKPLKDSLRRLKNLLKLPKARRWAYCEFFFSDIDRETLLSENEFKDCLNQSIPNLKTTRLRRSEWRQVRRLIGKPRRCSQAFFDSERAALHARRSRIREVQNGATLTFCSGEVDIPLKIPKPHTVGAKVFARVRSPKDGVYGGKVDAVMDGRYRIIFDKDLIMPLIVPDYEVMGEVSVELVSVSFFLDKNKVVGPNGDIHNVYPGAPPPATLPATAPKNDPLLSAVSYPPMPTGVRSTGTSSGPPAKVNAPPAATRDERCGNFPLRLVVTLVKLTKLLRVKKIFIAQIQDMNSEAERMHLYSDGYVQKFQQRYAKIIVELERVNNQLENYLCGISDFFSTLMPQLSEITITSRPAILHKFCLSHASQVVKNTSRAFRVQSPHSTQLITSLTALLFQIRALGQQHSNAFELNSLREAINEIKASLDYRNGDVFEDCIQVHTKQIEFTMKTGEIITLSKLTDS